MWFICKPTFSQHGTTYHVLIDTVFVTSHPVSSALTARTCSPFASSGPFLWTHEPFLPTSSQSCRRTGRGVFLATDRFPFGLGRRTERLGSVKWFAQSVGHLDSIFIAQWGGPDALVGCFREGGISPLFAGHLISRPLQERFGPPSLSVLWLEGSSFGSMMFASSISYLSIYRLWGEMPWCGLRGWLGVTKYLSIYRLWGFL